MNKNLLLCIISLCIVRYPFLDAHGKYGLSDLEEQADCFSHNKKVDTDCGSSFNFVYSDEKNHPSRLFFDDESSTFVCENKNRTFILSKLEEFKDKAVHINKYAMVAAIIAYHGYKFFARDAQVYCLSRDVLEDPYKNMVYRSTQMIFQLLHEADSDNFLEQIRALILLCRVPVPVWYAKSFYKGLDVVRRVYFNEYGNFCYPEKKIEARLIFKEYLNKVPAQWHDIAKISNWWTKNKKPYPVFNKYCADTMTESNELLLQIIASDNISHLVDLKRMVGQCASKVAYAVYDYHVSCFLDGHVNDCGVWKGAELDPLWCNMSFCEKNKFRCDQSLNELLIVRYIYAHKLFSFVIAKHLDISFDHEILLHACYESLPIDQSIFDEQDIYLLSDGIAGQYK